MLNQRIIALQCCVDFCHTTMFLSFIYSLSHSLDRDWISMHFGKNNLLFCTVLGPELVGFHQLRRRLTFSYWLFFVFSLSPLENGNHISILKTQHYFSRMLYMKGKPIPNPRHLFSILIKIPINCGSRLFVYALATNFLGAEFTLSNSDK